jgi:hypothetical protein
MSKEMKVDDKGAVDKVALDMLHNAMKLIQENFLIKKTKNYNLLAIFSNLKRRIVYYDGNILDYEQFLEEAIKDTAPVKKFLFKKTTITKVTKQYQLKNILVNLLIAIKHVTPDISPELKKFIEQEHGYKISNNSTLNLFNFIINFKYFGEIDTRKMIELIYPELLTNKVDRLIIEPPKVFEGGARTKTRKNLRRSSQTRSNRNRK